MHVLTIIVPHGEFRDAAAFCVDSRAAGEQGHDALEEAVLAGKVKRSVSIAIANQWVAIGFQQILDDLVLARDYSKMKGRLQRERCTQTKKKG